MEQENGMKYFIIYPIILGAVSALIIAIIEARRFRKLDNLYKDCSKKFNYLINKESHHVK